MLSFITKNFHYLIIQFLDKNGKIKFMNESKEPQSERIPEERFEPETPREKRLFEKSKRRWYEEEFEKVMAGLGKDENLVSEYNRFLIEVQKSEEDLQKKGKTADDIVNKNPNKSNESEETVTDEWSIENLNKLNDINPELIFYIIGGLLILRNFWETKLLESGKQQEAEDFKDSFDKLDKETKAQHKYTEEILVEIRKLFKNFNVPDQFLKINDIIKLGWSHYGEYGQNR